MLGLVSETTKPTSAADYAWGLQQAWSLTATTTKQHLARLRGASLGLLVLAALLGALSVQSSWFDGTGWPRVWSIAASISLGGAGAVETFYVTPARTRAWTTARTASERLKAAVWLFLSRITPYDGTDEERSQNLFDLIYEVEKRAASKIVRLTTDDPPRATPTVRSAYIGQDYCTQRAAAQRDYHRKASLKAQKKGTRLRLLVTILTLTGAAMGAIGGLFTTIRIGAWIAGFSSAAAAVATHAGAAQHEQIAFSYSATANLLELAIQRFMAAGDDPETAEEFIIEVERILAIQNEIWSDVLDR